MIRLPRKLHLQCFDIRRINDMPIVVQEPTRASIVVLNVQVPDNFRAGLIASLSSVSHGRLISATNPVEGDVLSLLTERINVKLNANRVMIEKEHPFGQQDWDHLSEVAEKVVQHFVPVSPVGSAPVNERRHTFGFNIEAICRPSGDEHAKPFLADGFFNLSQLKSSGFVPVEGSLQLTISDGQNRYWRIRVEPLVGATEEYSFFVSLNQHSENMVLPTTQYEIQAALQNTWNSIEAIVGSLEVAR